MRISLIISLLALGFYPAGSVQAQTELDLTKLIERLIELDSTDLAKDVKFRPGVEPSLYAVDADESQMKILKNPYEIQGPGKPGAAGWYRVSFVVPDKIGKIGLGKGYTLGVGATCKAAGRFTPTSTASRRAAISAC